MRPRRRCGWTSPTRGYGGAITLAALRTARAEGYRIAGQFTECAFRT